MAFTDILVPTDYGDASRHAAEVACELAAQSRGRVTLLHAWNVPLPAYAEGMTVPLDEMETAARQALEEEASRLRATCPGLRTLLVAGNPWRVILDTVKEHGFDLVVMGTHGRSALGHFFLGSVAERVVRASPAAVLTVHAREDPRHARG
jgi:nucleotide-binding universal stress UspA family protein